jgi:hypothetical protein
MTDPIEIEAKNDRELLLLIASKVNGIDDKLSSVCSVVETHKEELPKLKSSIKAVAKQADNTTKIVLWFIGVFGFILVALVIFALRTIHFPI